MPASFECRSCRGAAHGVYACLLPEQRSRLAKAVLPHQYQSHETIFHAGTPALAVYCVRSGSLKRFWRLASGEEVVVGVRGPGDFAGLRGVLGGMPYASTAATLDPATVCAIPAGVFVGLARESPAMGYLLLTRLAREARGLETQLVERTHDRVRKRTARFLLQRAQEPLAVDSTRARVDLCISREEMAQLIGTAPETLSRTLRSLANDGILDVGRREIRILNPAALLKSAE